MTTTKETEEARTQLRERDNVRLEHLLGVWILHLYDDALPGTLEASDMRLRGARCSEREGIVSL